MQLDVKSQPFTNKFKLVLVDKTDPTAAGQWLQNLPAGASREAAVQAYVGQLSYSSPELAAPWAETLTDQNNRNSQVENIARRWL